MTTRNADDMDMPPTDVDERLKEAFAKRLEVPKTGDYECVVLYSGGLDSYCALRLANKRFGWRNVLPLYVNLGHPYADKELAAIDSLYAMGSVQPARVIPLPLLSADYGNMPTATAQVVPGRNLIFASIAASFGRMVWLAALEDEMHDWMPSDPAARRSTGQRDKCTEFFAKTTDVLNFTFLPAREFTHFCTPFFRATKTEAVAMALRECAVDVEELRATTSCYAADTRNCGQCATCFKRWIALSNNGIKEVYAQAPWLSPAAHSLRAAYTKAYDAQDFSHYTRKRIEECQKAILQLVPGGK